MYLSKVNLSNSVHAHSELVKLAKNGAYSAHQLLWRLFPDEIERSFLFREETEANGLPVFYVLSASQPQSISPIFTVAAKSFQPALQPGDRLAYKLRVNPTICVKQGEGRGKRHDVLMHAKRQAVEKGLSGNTDLEPLMFAAARRWLADEKRLQQWGFSLDVAPDVESYTQHKINGKKGRSIQFSCADLQGVLTVDDPERFVKTLATGFGKSRAFGCGLMLVRRV